MKEQTIIGIDLGGTQIRGGLVTGSSVHQLTSERINAMGSEDEVLEQLFIFINRLINKNISAIGIGVPGLIDPSSGIVFDVVNIPSWQRIDLREKLMAVYGIPVQVQNDSNCFALGEFYFGKGMGHNSMIGLTIGTGLGAGIIINGVLYTGANGGAGEFGMAEYLDKTFEFYASGQFFSNKYGEEGEDVFEKAKSGDRNAIAMYKEMGMHLGNAIKNILYTYDMDLIVLGGSVSKAFKFFSESMWKQVKTFPYQKSVSRLRIEVSELENSAVIGAAIQSESGERQRG